MPDSIIYIGRQRRKGFTPLTFHEGPHVHQGMVINQSDCSGTLRKPSSHKQYTTMHTRKNRTGTSLAGPLQRALLLGCSSNSLER